MNPLQLSVTGVVDEWLAIAQGAIEEAFGDGAVAANPGLVMAYVQACATQLTNELLDSRLGAIEDRLRDIEDAIAHRE